jgi:PTH1 family peptidyl-tRNA hydrolase
VFLRKKRVEPALRLVVVGVRKPAALPVGFDVVERLAKVHGGKLDLRKHRAVYTVANIDGREVLLVKPLTYMNLSGQAVAAISRQYGIKPERILVIGDDLDLPTGKVRMKPKGGPGGHNGHRSIIASLGTQEYPRLRVGIGKGGSETIGHVLNRFRPEERPLIEDAIELCIEGCEIWLREGIEKAASWVNTRSGESGS